MLDEHKTVRGPATVGADKGYDTHDFIAECRTMNVVPHAAQIINEHRGSAIDARTTRHPGFAISQRIRKRIEEIFGWTKTVGGFAAPASKVEAEPSSPPTWSAPPTTSSGSVGWFPHETARGDPTPVTHRGDRRSTREESYPLDPPRSGIFKQPASAPCWLVYVDDATGRLMELRFVRSESTFDYFESTRSYLGRHGKPVAFYSDKAAIFRVNAKDPKAGDGYTQFGRAMFDLNIDVICANSPAAKGRVERAHQVLQDRLVKELRLRQISDMEAANVFAPEFIADYNRRFGRESQSAHDAHRPLLPHEKLDRVFTWQEDRRLTQNLTLHYRRVMYLIEPSDFARSAAGKYVQVRETNDGDVVIEYTGAALPGRQFVKDARVNQAAIADNKILGPLLAEIQKRQQERHAETLATKRLTLRDEDLMRKEMGQTGLPTRRKRVA